MIAYFVKHPNAANLMMAAAVVLGLVALPSMERETFPEFDASRVTVATTYTGASAADVDEEICQSLDDALTGVTDLDDFECVSVDNLGTATLTMADTGDIGQFYNDVASIASGLDLPDDADRPAVSIAGRTEVVALLAVSGVDGPGGLVRYADDLATRLGGLSKISQATVSGVSDGELQIAFDQQALRRFGLSPRALADAVSSRSVLAPLGAVDTTTQEYTLRYADARRRVVELEDLIVLQNETGGFVRLRDLATVRLVDATPENRSTIDGRRAAIIRIEKTKTNDAIDAFAQVAAMIADEEARLPQPFKIDVINNTTENIAARIELILVNTAQGFFLVIAVMWLFMHFREAFWISMTLPVSFLAGLFVLSSFGVSINMISLIALLMAVGLIMDDSIVIADNIAKWRGRVGAQEAAVRGAAEVLPGVVASFLTTACVFAPLMFLSGEMGSILQVIPVVLLITLAVSLVEAFLVLPNHLSHTPVDPSASKRRWAPRALEEVKESMVVPVVRRLVSWRYLTLGTVFAAFVLSAGLVASGLVKLIGFPTTEGDTVVARLALNAGAPLERTEAVVADVLAALDRVDGELTQNTENRAPLVERVLVQYATNADVKNNGPHTATITVDLLESARRNVAAEAMLDRWRVEFGLSPDVQQISFNQSSVGPGGSDIDLELTAPTAEIAERAADDLLRRLLARPDVREAYVDFRGGRPEIAIVLRSYGYALGLTPQGVADQLRAAFSGLEIDSFRQGHSSVSVRVALSDTIPTLGDLERFPIALADGRQTPLTTIATVNLTPAYPQITRKNGEIVARIVGQIDRSATTAATLSKVVMDEFGPEIRRLYPEATIAIGGATEDQQETQASIVSALLVGLVAVYIILAFQFRSYTLPIVVMLSIPFALIGTILGHLAFGIDVSMPSLIGFASLAGVVVNNAILFVAFFQSELRGADYIEAAVDAVRQRFRPVLLSSSTTFIGLMPILVETSPQAQVLVPLVVAVAFGLLASTILVVFVLPSALAVYFDHFNVEAWKNAQRADDEAAAPITAYTKSH